MFAEHLQLSKEPDSALLSVAQDAYQPTTDGAASPSSGDPGSSESLAAQLLGRYSTPSQAVMRAELKIRLQEALNRMDPLDREVLALRHFEELTNIETAQVLGLKQAAASNRYIRALERLRKLLPAGE